MKDLMPFCPRCKFRIFVGKVKSYDLEKFTGMSAYFCSDCLVEFDRDGNIIPPFLGESEDYVDYFDVPESEMSPWVIEFVKAAKEDRKMELAL